MENRVFGNQGKKMYKGFKGDEPLDFGGDESNSQKKLIAHIKYTRFFFLLGIWFGYFVILFLFAGLTTLLINNLSFTSKDFVTGWDILGVYCVFVLTFLGIKLFPLR